MIQVQAEAQNTTKSKLWKRVKCTEQSRTMARCVKTALRKQAACKGLSQVMAPRSNDDSTRVTYHNKADFKMACLEDARKQFTQAASIPCCNN